MRRSLQCPRQETTQLIRIILLCFATYSIAILRFICNFASPAHARGFTLHSCREGRHITRRNLRFCSDCVESGKFKNVNQEKSSNVTPYGCVLYPSCISMVHNLRCVMMICICTAWGWRCSFRRTGIPEPYAVERARLSSTFL